MVTNLPRWTTLGLGGLLILALGLRYRPGDAVTESGTAEARGAQDSVPPLSAALLRRLAAAADGYRTGEPVYIVASYVYPYSVLAVVGTRDSAETIAHSFGRSTTVFGPYVTPSDFGRPASMLLLAHMRPTVWGNDSAPPWRDQDIDSVAVTVYHHSRGQWRRVTHGLSHDALFFDLSAIDKFAVPYYTQLYGPAYADSMRRSLGAYLLSRPEE